VNTTIKEIVAEAEVIYMPKGKEAVECTSFLEAQDITPPLLNDDFPEGEDRDGRRYMRVRATDGVRLLECGIGGRAIAFAGTDVCDKLIDSNPNAGLAYEAFGIDAPAMCVYEILEPKDAPSSFRKRIRGEGEPIVAVTSSPGMLTRYAQEKDLNVVPHSYAPDGGVEIIARQLIRAGEAHAAADLVTSGKSADAAGFWSSKSEDRPNPDGFDPVLKSIYGAIIWRKSGSEYEPPVDLDKGVNSIDATLVERFTRLGSSAIETDTTRLLGSPQKALAKSVEEGLELALAILTNESRAVTVAELADRVRADVLFANSLRAGQGQPPITYRAFLEVLINRNQRK
jgi:hypothetical protein